MVIWFLPESEASISRKNPMTRRFMSGWTSIGILAGIGIFASNRWFWWKGGLTTGPPSAGNGPTVQKSESIARMKIFAGMAGSLSNCKKQVAEKQTRDDSRTRGRRLPEGGLF